MPLTPSSIRYTQACGHATVPAGQNSRAATAASQITVLVTRLASIAPPPGQPATSVTSLTGDMGNSFLDLKCGSARRGGGGRMGSRRRHGLRGQQSTARGGGLSIEPEQLGCGAAQLVPD